MRALPTLTACGLVLAAIALLPAPLAAQSEEEAEAPAKAEAPAEAEAEAAGKPRPGPSGGGGDGWWNEPRIAETLSLSEAQREKMDGHLADFRSKLAPTSPEARNAFVEALESGDWKAARKALDELSEEVGQPVRSHGELKIGVLSTLSDEQRAKLAENYPRLIGQPWVRMGRRPQARRPR